VASGWHTAALSMRLHIDAVLGRFPGGSMGAQVDTLSWMRPVRPGDRLFTRTEILALRPSTSRPDRGWLTLRTTTFNQADEAVQVMTANVVAPRRGLGGGGSRRS
ncbi:MAG: dehydratase, partial [Gemmatimonadaceae bacterium]|nr:dehydratase [Acetobacteraceae bacterium]